MSVGKCVGVWGRWKERYRGVREGKGRWGCKKCGRVYGVSVESVGKSVGVWGR